MSPLSLSCPGSVSPSLVTAWVSKCGTLSTSALTSFPWLPLWTTGWVGDSDTWWHVHVSHVCRLLLILYNRVTPLCDVSVSQCLVHCGAFSVSNLSFLQLWSCLLVFVLCPSDMTSLSLLCVLWCDNFVLTLSLLMWQFCLYSVSSDVTILSLLCVSDVSHFVVTLCLLMLSVWWLSSLVSDPLSPWRYPQPTPLPRDNRTVPQECPRASLWPRLTESPRMGDDVERSTAVSNDPLQ